MRLPGLILLAAGGSRRMGQPKQLLRWQGRSFLRHACETALATSCRPIVVVLGCEAQACMEEVADLEVTTIVNADWRQGMGHSLSVGVGALEQMAPEVPGALIMLVDQPTVIAEFLQSLLLRWLPPQWPIVATRYAEGGGVPAIIGRSYFAELRELNADRGAAKLLEREKDRVALVDVESELIDFDTPEAYRKRREVGADGSPPTSA